MTHRHGRRICAAALLLSIGTLALVAGCNIVGPIGYLAHGPEKADAAYDLPPEKATVIFLDDRDSKLPSRAVRKVIAKSAETEILRGKVLTGELISSDAILNVTSAEKIERPQTIAQVGTAVGAKTVIYATVDAFALSTDGAQFSPVAQLRVKVIDAETQARLFPAGDTHQQWAVVSVSMPDSVKTLPRSTGEKTVAEQEFANLVGMRLGQMFTKHLARDPNPRIGK